MGAPVAVLIEYSIIGSIGAALATAPQRGTATVSEGLSVACPIRSQNAPPRCARSATEPVIALVRVLDKYLKSLLNQHVDGSLLLRH